MTFVQAVERIMTFKSWARRRKKGLVRCRTCAVDISTHSKYHMIPATDELLCSSCYKKEAS